MTEVSRRQLLAWTGSAGATGLVAGLAGGFAAERGDPFGIEHPDDDRLRPYDQVVDEHAVPHGLDKSVPAFGQVLSFKLKATGRSTPARARAASVKALTALAAQIGRAVDEQEKAPAAAAALGTRPANLQLTPGIGATLLTACGLEDQRPEALIDLPDFATDRLDPALCGGDLLVQVGADDPMRLAGAVQEVRSTLAADWDVAWSRSGFRITSAGADDPKATVRNLMGHRDGTANSAPGSPLWNSTVITNEPGWMQGGSYLVARQILIDLDRWFGHDESARDDVIGRNTVTGVALGGKSEHETVDLGARTSSGQLAVPPHAHIRLAGTRSTLGARIYRRGWNFDDGDTAAGRRAGLMFLAWQADIEQGFLPIQKSLVAGHDSLNDFTTHIGSAVFAVPAMGEDDYVGQRLFEKA